MKKNDKKAFTLIELIAVLVILAVITLIVTPLVLNIIKSAKKSANERSVDEYGKAVELAAASYLLDTGKKANSFDVLNVEYSGNEVKCNVSEVYKNNVFLSQCSVNGKEVKNAKTTDGYYHYGDATKFVDLYGEAVKKAIVRYQKDNNEMPTNLNELTINADGLNVSCNSSKINSDGTIYLSNCGLNNVILTDDNTNDNYYHYGENKYLIGDKVNYKGIEFYVIENVGDESDTVHLLKADPIKQGEVKNFISSTELIDKINFYDDNSYLEMQYLYKDTFNSSGNISGINVGCSIDYSQSSVKQVVDVCTENYLNDSDLVSDNEGYKVRLLTKNDLVGKLGFYQAQVTPSDISYESNISFMTRICHWTMIAVDDSDDRISYLCNSRTYNANIWYSYSVAPVINIKKSVLGV